MTECKGTDAADRAFEPLQTSRNTVLRTKERRFQEACLFWYALFEENASVNVYQGNGEFLYAYKIPAGKNGSVEMAIDEPYVYIKNRDDKVFIYCEKQFENIISLEDAKKQQIDFVEYEDNLDKGDLIRTKKDLFFMRNKALLMILGLVLIIGSIPLISRENIKSDR